MNIRQIRYFVSACESGSLSAAAKSQFVTVQAVSKAISEFEDELGVQLLCRGNHGVAPTAVGEAFCRRAKTVLEDFDKLTEFTQGFPADRSANILTVCLCSPQFESADVALGNIARMTERVLGLKTTIITSSGERGLEALNSGAVDAIATIGMYQSPTTDTLTVGSLPAGVVLASGHPLACSGKRALRLADLEPYPMLSSDKYDTFNQSILRMLQSRGLKSPILPYTEKLDVDAFFQRDHGMVCAVHVPSIVYQKMNTVNMPLEGDCSSVPLCLVSLKERKTAAYCKLEKHVGEIFRGGAIL